MVNFTVYSHASIKGLAVAVRQFAETPPKCLLTITIGNREAEIDIFTEGQSLDQFLDLGYAIIAECNKLKPAPEPEYVPFAINDAVEHENAMAEAEAINFKPD